MGDINPLAGSPELWTSGEIEFSMSKQVNSRAFILSALGCSCAIVNGLKHPLMDFPTVMDCDLELWAETNPFSSKLTFLNKATAQDSFPQS